jgi:hypothetical protein
MLVLHGENLTQSRNRLFQFLEAAKLQQKLITRIDAKPLTLPMLENALGSTSLFLEPKVVVIEELHSLPKSKRKDELIEYLSDATENPDSPEIILWEKRQLTPTMLKKFPGAQAEEFKLTNVLFKWLDSLIGKPNDFQKKTGVTLLRQAMQSDGDMMCFVMLIRQVRLLLEVADGGGQKMPPFMIGKLRKQAQSFSLEQLLKLHHHLLEIDHAQKTSKSLLGLGRELELLCLSL